MTSPDWWRDALTGDRLREEGDRVYFSDPPADVFTDTQRDVPRQRWSGMRRAHYDWLAAELETLPDGRRLVDIGCGQSQFRDLYTRHFPCGIDFFPYDGARVVCDLNRPQPFSDGTVEAAVLSNVLEHIYEPRALIEETHRILKPGGHMLIVVPFFIKIHQPPYDFFRYTNFALERLCRDAGFPDVRVDPMGNLFDTYDIDRSVRTRILTREVSGLRLLAMRGLLWSERKLDAMAHRIAVQGVRKAADRDGFPHSFAVHAIKT